jgi:hypothetical protein
MLIDQINPYLPKDNEEVDTHVKRLQAMLDATTVVGSVHDHEDRVRVMSMITGRVPVRTRLVASLHRRIVAKDMVGTTVSQATPSTVSYPDSKRSEAKLPYVCPGCSNHTYDQQ